MKLKSKLIFAIVTVSIGMVGCSTEDSKDVNLTTQQEISKENNSANEVQEENLPNYKIALIDDSNIGNIVRETLHIVVEDDFNLDQLKSIAEKEALNYTKDHDVNALAIGFYQDEANIGKGYDMGRVEYVPNGKWSDAVNITAGNYENFKFVDYLEEPLDLPKGESIESTSGQTDIEMVKSDILNVNSDIQLNVDKDGSTLLIKIKEKEDHPLVAAEENAIASYTDWCLENIKSDISCIDISVERPNSSVRAVLNMSDMETSNGRYFDTSYIANNIK